MYSLLLGVQLKNKTKYEDMIEIMLNLHKYVPSKTIPQTIQVHESEHTIEEKHLYPLIFGGGSAVCYSIQGKQDYIRHSLTNSFERLEGLWPVVENWHKEVVV